MAVPCTAAETEVFFEQWITSIQRAQQTGTIGTDCVPVPGRWTECTSMVPGTWREYFVLIQMAVESVCHGTGTA